MRFRSFPRNNRVFWFQALLCLFAAAAQPVLADTTLTVDPHEIRVASFDGWGCSLAWWANQFGSGPEANVMADLCFTEKQSVAWHNQSLPGLALNIVRYNVGGSGPPAMPDALTAERRSPKMPAFKSIEAFQRDDRNPSPGSSRWNWNADAAQRNMLRLAVARGVTRCEFFSNSPPWWMTYNKSSAGGDAGQDNLQPSNYLAFVRYLAGVAQNIQAHSGVRVISIAPFNEPSAYWWKFPSAQEGCHFTSKAQQSVIGSLRQELNRIGLKDTVIAASDENDCDTGLASWNALGPETQRIASRLNVHGYYGLAPYRGQGRSALRRATLGKKLWMSEYGDNDASGLTMARSLLSDLNDLRPEGWFYWQPFDSGGWGLIQSNPGDNWTGPANRKYLMFAQFTRHIRPGDTIIGCSDRNSVAAYSAKRHRLVIVALNAGPAQAIHLDLAMFSAVSGTAERWTTTLSPEPNSADLQYDHAALPTSNNRSLTISMSPNSVVTLEIDAKL